MKVINLFLTDIVQRPCNASLFTLLGASDDTWEYLESYVFWTVAVGSCPTVMNTEFAHLVRSEGYSREASIGVALGGILNIVLDPVFIFGFHMQIRGAAIATMLSNTCSVIYILLFLQRIRKKTSITVNPVEISFRAHFPGGVISAGVPSAVMTLTSTLSNTVLNNLIFGYSTEANSFCSQGAVRVGRIPEAEGYQRYLYKALTVLGTV